MAIEKLSSMDFQELDILRFQARKDQKAALPEVAKQFEALFLESMLKTMRMGQLFLDEDSPFKGKSEATFQEMLDSQYSTNISKGRGIGFAEMLTKQLQNTVGDSKPTAEIKTINAAIQPLPKGQILVPIANNEPIKENDSPKPDMDAFIKSIWPYARQAASALGLDPKILMAQAVLETGWGQFVAQDTDGSSSNNLFNIKAGTNNTDDELVKVKTKEYIADTPITMQANFRKYPSVEHSFNDYVSLIKGDDRYQDALTKVANPEQFMQAIHKAGYATDPNYSSKIMSIYNGTELQKSMQRCGIR
jgi:flagellar protein FlgJ